MQIKDGIVTQLDGISIIQHLIPVSNKLARPQYPMKPEYITIHNTGNPGASALANSIYVDTVNSYTSWHFTVGHGEVYQELPITESAWHAGDGAEGTGNRKSIGIEIAEVDRAEETAIKFIAQLIKATGISIDKVVPHRHWSGKNCPRLVLPHWDKFIADIIKELEPKAAEGIKRYKNISEMPEFYQEFIKKWVAAGYIKGNKDGTLDFTEDMIRCLIIAERMQEK
ncbi:MAG TPA: hypothetical protein DC038_03605 [Clostridiales bacterium]|nr:hypothetical protein [Clostridiales bacterium]